MTSTDTELLDWLAEQPGYALINDDFGRWACTGDGMQEIPDGIEDQPVDLNTSFFIEADDWKPTIREAIEAAKKKHGE